MEESAAATGLISLSNSGDIVSSEMSITETEKSTTDQAQESASGKPTTVSNTSSAPSVIDAEVLQIENVDEPAIADDDPTVPTEPVNDVKCVIDDFITVPERDDNNTEVGTTEHDAGHQTDLKYTVIEESNDTHTEISESSAVLQTVRAADEKLDEIKDSIPKIVLKEDLPLNEDLLLKEDLPLNEDLLLKEDLSLKDNSSLEITEDIIEIPDEEQIISEVDEIPNADIEEMEETVISIIEITDSPIKMADNIETPDVDKDDTSSKTELNEVEEGNTCPISISNQTLAESIASDWSFPEDSPDVENAAKVASGAFKKSSAEIIAMDWDENLDSVHSTSSAKEDADSVEICTDVPKSITTEELDTSEEIGEVLDSSEVICTVVDADSLDKDSDGIIILHEISELNVDPSETRGITIISVDEHSKIISSPSQIISEFPVEQLDVNKQLLNMKVDSPNDPPKKTSKPQKVEEKGKTSDNPPVKMDFPAHILGRNVENPASDTTWKGRPLSKPRMGVKVPYRNLTSQICSKDEIQEQVAQAKALPNPDLPAQGDVLFTAKLFNNLAKKIFSKEKRTTEESLASLTKSGKSVDTIEKKVSDQELLAILEGDAEIDVYNMQKQKEVSTPLKTRESLQSTHTKTQSSFLPPPTTRKGKKTDMVETLDPDLAREIALRQLSQLPEPSRRRGRSGKQVTVVSTNVPKTRIIENSDKSGDPFTFDENSKSVDDPPAKYEPVPVKTYSRKSNNEEPDLEEIEIPKEILDIESSPKGKKDAKIAKNAEPVRIVKKKIVRNPPPKIRNLKFIAADTLKKPRARRSSEKTLIPGPKSSTDVSNIVLMSKRSRIIKKKVIWDPSYKISTPSHTLENRPKVTPTPVVKAKVVKQLEQKKPIMRTKKPIPVAIEDLDTSLVEMEKESSPEVEITNDRKRRQSDANSSKKKKLKRVTEVDRLLMDEGALNMLYAVEQDEKVPLIREKQRVISIDKFAREMTKKKRMIMTALNTTETSPKSLRRKESPTAGSSKKKSVEVLRSFLQSPPPSPSSMFPPRAEASRIIRRHSSSSSFSSECLSPRRLSTVDAVPEKVKTETACIEVPKKSEANTNGKVKGLNKSPGTKRGVPIFVKKMKPSKYTGNVSGIIAQAIATETVKSADIKAIKEKVLQKPKVVEQLSRKDIKLPKKLQDSKAETEPINSELAASETPKVVKLVRKDTTVKSTSPDSESYSNVVKALDIDSQRKKAFLHDEKQRTSGRPNAGTYNYKEISLRKFDNLVQIILTPQSTKIKNALNLPVMRELCDALATLKKDTTCRAVLITSTGSVFCKGLDYTPLIQANGEKRKVIAQEMANAVKELVRSIAHFPRPLIAGVQGAAYGLGVAILPLCDLVFVSDKATFSMNQSKLGCVPEGAATVTLPHVTSHAVASELLIAGHTLTATEALRHGLASRVLWPEGYFKELIPMCKTVASRSSQSIDSTKALIRHALLLKVEAALDSETHLLIQHWTSSECQQLFKKALEQDSW